MGVLSCLAESNAQNQLAIATGLVSLQGLGPEEAKEQLSKMVTEFSEAADIRGAIARAGAVARGDEGDEGGGGLGAKSSGTARKSVKKSSRRKSEAAGWDPKKGFVKAAPTGEGTPPGEGGELGSIPEGAPVAASSGKSATSRGGKKPGLSIAGAATALKASEKLKAPGPPSSTRGKKKVSSLSGPSPPAPHPPHPPQRASYPPLLAAALAAARAGACALMRAAL